MLTARAGRLCIVAILLAACASPGEIASRATTYNLAVEQANNEAMLLNVLRASKRRPMHFTYVTALHGGPGASLGSASLALPFKGTGANYVLTPSFGYGATSSFDVGVLDSSEFIRGITTPIELSLLHYYWQQGWSKELLLLLFVKHLTTIEYVANRPARSTSFDNYPDDRDNFDGFKERIRKLLAENDLRIEPVDKEEPIGPALDVKKAEDFENLLTLQATEGISIKCDGDPPKVPATKCQITKSTSKPSFSFEPQRATGCAAVGRTTALVASERTFATEKAKEPAVGPCHPLKITIDLRSPEAALYYLGELVRVQLRNGGKYSDAYTARICQHSARSSHDPGARLEADEQPIFDVRPLGDIAYPGSSNEFMVRVKFDDSYFGIPRATVRGKYEECSAETTMHVLSLMTQVISLKRSAKDLPSPAVVHVIER
jgi:hypothetical protein